MSFEVAKQLQFSAIKLKHRQINFTTFLFQFNLIRPVLFTKKKTHFWNRLSCVSLTLTGEFRMYCQINPSSPTNFTNQHAFNQTERNKSARVECGWMLSLRIFQNTGLDTSGLEETWHYADPSPVCVQRIYWMLMCHVKIISWLSPYGLIEMFLWMVT